MFTSLDQIKLGARYKDVISGHIGIYTAKKVYLTGCDRVSLESASEGNAKDSTILDVDITCIEYVNEGVVERFETKPAAAVAGGPSVRTSR